MNRRPASGSSRRPVFTRIPVTIRLPENIVKQIDKDLNQRDVPLSRNNWLLEAAIEKLRKNGNGETHGSQ
jgi:hypothetical protein